MKNILVTGGAGFIGSNFIKYMLNKYSDYKIVNVDALTYAGSLKNLKSVEENKNYEFIKLDICDRENMDKVFKRYEFDYVINFAAETHVDRSIEDPDVFLKTNVLGTGVLLDAAKKYWNIDAQNKYSKEYKDGVKFVQISTDEVYGSLGSEGKFTEDMAVMPNNPYSASKASADLLIRSYNKTYGLPVNITRCGNNYGPNQFPEKLIPLMILNCAKSMDLPVYGDGKQIRDWIHVSDHCSAIDTVLHKGKSGEVYNIGCDRQKTNIDIVKLIIKTLGKSESIIKHIKDRPGHDRRYAIDNTKIKSQLGWKSKIDFEQGISDTIKWYMDNPDWVKSITSGEYKNYYKMMYGEQN